MPDKPNENKLMAMLERKGIVRKADSEDGLTEEDVFIEDQHPETDLFSILGQNVSDEPKITPAPHQPVPGMITPVMPSSPLHTSSSKPHEPGRSQSLKQEPEQQQTGRQSKPELQQQDKALEPEPPQPNKPPEQERQQPVKPPEAIPLSGGSGYTKANSPASAPFTVQFGPSTAGSSTADNASIVSGSPPDKPELKAENFTDRYLEVDELYEVLSIKSKKTDSIYLVEEYLKTLPDSLPDKSRREIVSKIVTASGFDFDRLMGDGVLRVRMLKEYAESFARYTESYIAARNAELEELEQQIMRIHTLIEGRKEMHKKQFFTIEAEAQRLKEILTFISG